MKKKNEIARLFMVYSMTEALTRDILASEIAEYVKDNGNKPSDLSDPRYDGCEVALEVEVKANIGYGLLAFDVTRLALAADGELYLLRLNDNEWETVKSLDIEVMYDLYGQLCK